MNGSDVNGHTYTPLQPPMSAPAAQSLPPPWSGGVMRPQDMAMSLWALGKLRYKAAWLLDELPLSLGAWLHAFSPRDVCCVLHGYAAARHYHKGVMEAAAALLHPRLPTLTLDELITTLQAYSVFQHRPLSQPAFLPALAEVLHARLRGRGGGGNSNSHSSSSGGRMAHAGNARPQTYALIAKACANLQFRPEPLLADVVAAAAVRLHDFKPEEMAHLLYGLSHLVSRPPHCQLPASASPAAPELAAADLGSPVAMVNGSGVTSGGVSRAHHVVGAAAVEGGRAVGSSGVLRRHSAAMVAAVGVGAGEGGGAVQPPPSLPSLRPEEMQLFYHVVRQCIRLLDEPSHPYAAPTHLHHQVRARMCVPGGGGGVLDTCFPLA
jgi:hypothetical protein